MLTTCQSPIPPRHTSSTSWQCEVKEMDGRLLLDWQLHLSRFDKDGDPVYDIFVPSGLYARNDRLAKFVLDTETKPGYLRFNTSFRNDAPAFMLAKRKRDDSDL